MRLIDADALIESMGLTDCHKGYKAEAYDTRMNYEVLLDIENAPTISQWIPVSERLPDVDDTRELLVLIKRSLPIGVVANNPYTCKVAKFYDKYKGSSLYGGAKFYGAGCNPDCEVIAWMPLPEPYKESDK